MDFMCATCKNRGRSFEHRDENMIMHCAVLSRNEEIDCISQNHKKWESDFVSRVEESCNSLLSDDIFETQYDGDGY